MKVPSTATVDNPNYRPDIDGLRAIAVLSVILYHINDAILPGGFVGVDIFFVISGYLISLHIFRDSEMGRFSLLEFYRRRVKRIAPVMLVVVAFVIFIAQVIMRPVDAERVAESGLWSLLSLANVYFWLYQDTSYFAAASSELPLLHLWSLGVEEQFYIFWPLILMLVYRLKSTRWFFATMIVVATLSFLLGEYLFDDAPSFVYYMLPTRAGELLVGAGSAYLVLKRGTQKISPEIVTFTAILGLALIAGALALLSEEQTFPGLRAIPPTLGTAMLILAGHYGNSWPSRLMTLKPMVWVGMISYSAYLWHWPLLAFYRYGYSEITFVPGAVIFILTFLLAWLSYLYVESPARRSSRPALQIFAFQYIFPAGTLALVALISMKIDGYGLRWFSEEYKSSLASLYDETRPAYDYDYVCQRQRVQPEDINNAQCIVGAESNKVPKAILWGDSNAAHFVGMLGVFAREGDFRFQNLEIGSCPPINSDPADFVAAHRLSDCRGAIELVWPNLKQYQVVVISASWSGYQSRSDQFLKTFFRTANSLAEQGKLVILLGKIPVISSYDRYCREKALSYPVMKCESPQIEIPANVADANAQLEAFASQTKNVEFYAITEYLCPKSKCSPIDERGRPMYYDSSHLSLPASWQIGKRIFLEEGVPFPFTLIPGWSTAAKHTQ
ncbi:MAG: acyltransferase family protein [Pseudomonadales bacterium]